MAMEHGRGNPRSNSSGNAIEERLATGLGWFSLGLGLAEVLAPRSLAQLIGVRDTSTTRTVLRTYGLREITAGIGILAQPRPAGWVWSRVAGDALDLSSLAKAMSSNSWSPGRVAAATAAVAGVTILDIYCGKRLSQDGGRAGSKSDTVRLTKTLIINRSPEEVYGFWRNFSNLPQFMPHLESVQVTGERRSHWKAKGTGGVTVEWDAETVDDQPGRRIAWRALESSDVYHSGSVSFERAPGGRGTMLRVEMDYAPPGGKISAKIAKLFQVEPGQQLESDLRALKQILETGEIVRSDASIHTGMHPAQPPTDAEAPKVPSSRGNRIEELRPSLV